MAFDGRAFFTEKSETRSGLPNEELEREINLASGEPEPSPDTTPQLPARFTQKSSGWK
jgi:hypothetical protein